MPSDFKGSINCAHRGASAHAPENTPAASALAMTMGAKMCEIDVRQSADDRLFLLHDDTLERTTNGTWYLWQKAFAELQGLDAGGWFNQQFTGEPLPTLEEVRVRNKITFSHSAILTLRNNVCFLPEFCKLIVATLACD